MTESTSANRTSNLTLDPRTYSRGLSCVHCGLCLPACPTYTETGNEADSPRGRIQLMLAISDRRIEPTPAAVRHLDLCLDCRACESACPSGVQYHELIEATRANFHQHDPRRGKQSVASRLLPWLFEHVFTHPNRLKAALLPARLMQKIGVYGLLRKSGVFRLLPAGFEKMEQMLPPDGSIWPRRLPARIPTAGAKTTVAFVPGCVGSVMFDRVNRMAVELLSACGANVIVPPAVRCCGAIQHHNGSHSAAVELARRNIDALLPAGGEIPQYITTTIAGCGAMIREYDALLRDDPRYAERARVFASKVRDISEVLLELGLPEMKHAVNETATYHDACHLLHAQKVAAPPRTLLSRVPGLKLVSLPESDMCCGAAGTYNLTEPEMATRLAQRKLKWVDSTGCGLLITGNVGCAMHIESQAIASGRKLRVAHPVELLHQAVFGAK